MSTNDRDSIIPGLLWFLAGLAILGWQCFAYLRDGMWTPISLLTIYQHLVAGELLNWVHRPDSWQGLHKVLSVIPPSAVLMVVGYFAMGSR